METIWLSCILHNCNSLIHQKDATIWCTWLNWNYLPKSKTKLEILVQRFLAKMLEFEIVKHAILVMHKQKVDSTKVIQLSNHEIIRTLNENEHWKCLEIQVADWIKQNEMKGKLKRFVGWNSTVDIKGINVQTVSIKYP